MTPSEPAAESESALTLGPEASGMRLDQALAQRLPARSRSFLTTLIKDGAVLVDGRAPKPSRKMKGGERIEIEWAGGTGSLFNFGRRERRLLKCATDGLSASTLAEWMNLD